MLKTLGAIGCISVFLITFPFCAYAEYSLAYEYYMESGMSALKQGDYQAAGEFFYKANLVDPSSEAPLSYLNFLKRLKEGRIDNFESQETQPPILPRESRISDTVEPSPIVHPQEIPDKPAAIVEDKQKAAQRERAIQEALDSIETTRIKKEDRLFPALHAPVTKTRMLIERPAELANEVKYIFLDDALWATQPKTSLRVEMNDPLVLEGNNIDRFLVLSPDFVDIERLDRNHIKVIGKRRGTTIFHLWDDRGRWTFNVEVLLPMQTSTAEAVEVDQIEESAQPFKFSYSSDWSSFYTGNSVRNLERQNLNYLQWTEISGETPLGQSDASAVFNKFEESTEVTGYSLGLRDGHIGTFKDFSIRGFDASKSFSPLSLPGRYFRGVLFEAQAFNNNLEYNILKGRDRVTYGFVNPGVVEERDSFIEGARITLFPKTDHFYSFNFARGYGDAREDFLKDKVFSVETKQKFANTFHAAELAYDEENVAKTTSSEFRINDATLRLNFRDIEKDYATITGLPSNKGEIGGNILFNWNMDKLFTTSNLDIYRDRFLPNPDDPEAYNYDFNTSVDVAVTPTSDWRTNYNFLNTPGVISPRQSLRLNSTYTKRFMIFDDRIFSVFWDNSYQRSRFEFSPASEYDRYGVTGGFRFPLLKSLSYYLNYEQSWVNEILAETQSTPGVLNTGLNYSKQISESWSGNTSFSYRDEERTEGARSFLAGEDSITGSLGLSYRPSSDFEFFVDGRMRNVWAENRERSPFNEGEVRWGVRSSWDLPFVWNPQGEIGGIVFKDANGNGEFDKAEEGIPNIIIRVGKKEAVTDQNGRYRIKVRAKRVMVSIGFESIPNGFVVSTPLSKETEIFHLQQRTVNFGLTTQSGVYGVVYFDQNQDGKLDQDDILIPKASILLDGKDSVLSDYEGTYFFKNISAGKHTISLEVNSLPVEYLPTIKLKNEVEIGEGTTYVFHIPLKKK